MIVVIDSNIFFSDFLMRRPRFRLIREEAREGRFQLAIPEVVVQETVNLYREELVKAHASLQDRIQKPLSRLNELESGLQPSTDLDIDATVATYERLLRERLADVRANVLPLPNVPEQDVIDRALARRKPFKRSDAGYRDTLIWESVLRVAQDDDVVLISNNQNDFGEDDTPESLASHLKEDLAAAGLPAERVVLVHDTTPFIDRYVPASAVLLQQVRDATQTPESPLFAQFASVIQQAVLDYPVGRETPRGDRLDEIRLPYGGEADGANVSMFGDVTDIEIHEARDLAGNEAVLEFSADVEVTIEYFLPKWEAWQIDEDESPRATFVERDWNEHYSWVEAELELDLVLVGTFDTEQNDLTEVEILWATTP
ncbi:MAG: PIN domain-containing protein [Actinomycetota bacterium]|nr:PIN domain-containing protein [Actinomycetota bacterium]